MKTAYPQLCLLTLTIAGLTACGGGGGGGSGGSRGVGVTVTPFTTWSAIAPGSTIEVAGDSLEGTYTFNTMTRSVTARTVGVQQSGAIFTETFSATPPYLAQNVRFRTASGTDISFSRATDTFFILNINTNFWGVESADETKYALMADPIEIGWDYQSFGI